MSVWPALWAVQPSGAIPGTVTAILSGVVHPQGFQTGPVGALYIRTTDGALYRKLGGGVTAFGWYPVASQDGQGFIGWRPAGANAACYARGINCTDFTGNPSGIFGNPPTKSGSAALYDRERQYAGGLTSGVLNNIWIGAPNAVINSFPSIGMGGNYTAAVSPFDFDLVWEVITTPRATSASGANTLASIRLYAGAIMQNTTIQLGGGTGNTDAIYTEFASSLGLNAGMFGIMWRFSTSAGDATWTLLTANDNGAASAQTVTPIGAAIAVDTIYKLRARMQLVAGVWTVFGSINNGAETAIVGNVGPGSTPVAAGAIRLIPYLSCRALVGATKAYAFSEMSLAFGSECAA